MNPESIIVFITPTTKGNVNTKDPSKRWIYGFRFSGDALPPESIPVAVATVDSFMVLNAQLMGTRGHKTFNKLNYELTHDRKVMGSPDLLWRYGDKRAAAKYLWSCC